MAPTWCVVMAMACLGACHRPYRWTANTPDLRASLVVEEREGKHCVRLATRDDGCFDGVDVHSIAFDETGMHSALAVRVGIRWGVAVNGRLGAMWDGVGAPRMSSSGGRVAYAADSSGRWRVVHDGAGGPSFDAILAGSLQLDHSGCTVAYVARRGADLLVVAGAYTSIPWLAVRSLVLAHTSEAVRDSSCRHTPSVAYAARDSAGWHLVIDGQAGPPYDAVRDVRFGALHDDVVAIARSHDRESLIRGRREPSVWHDEIIHVAVGRDGRVGYLVQDGDDVVALVDGHTELARGAVTDLALGGDGDAVWVVDSGRRQSIVSATGSFVFDRVVEGTLQYLATGQSWAALVGDRARRELRIVVDGRDVGRRFDWSEITRRLRQGGGADAVRAWVAAEAVRHP